MSKAETLLLLWSNFATMGLICLVLWGKEK